MNTSPAGDNGDTGTCAFVKTKSAPGTSGSASVASAHRNNEFLAALASHNWEKHFGLFLDDKLQLNDDIANLSAVAGWKLTRAARGGRGRISGCARRLIDRHQSLQARPPAEALPSTDLQ